VVVNWGATQLRTYVPAKFVEKMLQAYNLAIVDNLRISHSRMLERPRSCRDGMEKCAVTVEQEAQQ